MGHKPSRGGKPQQTPLTWAVPGDPLFEHVRRGATIVASGLSLPDQLQRLIELIVEATGAASGAIYLSAPESAGPPVLIAHTGDEAWERLRSSAETKHFIADIARGDIAAGEICLTLSPGKKLNNKLEEFVALISRQILSSLERDRSAWHRLVSSRR